MVDAPGTAPGSVLVVRGLSHRFRRRTVLDRVNLDVAMGVHALLGPNGAGKTTLFKIVGGLLRPTTGSVELCGAGGRGPGSRPFNGRIGWVPQDIAAPTAFAVRDLVAYAGWLKGLPSAALAGATERALVAVDLQDRAGSRVGSLSGGMRRRLGVAQAIVHEPTLLLLDEPTAGLDPLQRAGMRQLVRQLGQTCAVVLATHLVEDVAASATSATVLHEGGVRFSGPLEELASPERPAWAQRQDLSDLEAGFLGLVEDSST